MSDYIVITSLSVSRPIPSNLAPMVQQYTENRSQWLKDAMSKLIRNSQEAMQ